MEKEKRKKQKVLMPAGIRSKLMAAASMLMVGVIMMVSSTYAWFTLSTAPEVKNISTTVAGNGSLEIALMPTEGLLSKITAGAVGGTGTVVQKNTKWGNQIILSDDTEAGDYYGLNSISLNPASLNYTKADDSAEATFVADKPLAIATYGSDGRIAELSAENIGVKGKTETFLPKKFRFFCAFSRFSPVVPKGTIHSVCIFSLHIYGVFRFENFFTQLFLA